MRPLCAGLLLATLMAPWPAATQTEDLSAWPPLQRRFESTGGGGWIIDDYDPMLDGAACRTDFTAVSPEGQRIDNRVVFDAVPVAGGILCQNGRWSGRRDDSSGTTPIRIFIRADGARFRSP